MLMLSNLERFTVVDEKGTRAKFADLSVALLDSDYPIVKYLFFKLDKKFFRLAWDAVHAIDRRKKLFTVTDLAAGSEVSLEPQKHYVLLRYEILDALLLDLQNRRSFRANDLQLRETEDGRLELFAADTGASAILRRISFGFYKYVSRSGIYDWKYVEFLRGNPKAVKNGAGYHLRITRMSAGEIGQLTNFIPYLHAAELLTLLPDKQAVKTLEVMPVERQLQVFEELEDDQAIRLLSLMAPDVAADLIGRLQTDAMKLFLEKMPRERSQPIVELLRYPEDSVGGIMTNDVVYFPADLTVAEARIRFRERFPQTDFIYLIYIVGDDKNRTLRGMISVRNLLTAGDDQKLEAIMDPYIATLSSIEPAQAAAYRVVGSQLAAMPVVGLNNKLLGASLLAGAVLPLATSYAVSEAFGIPKGVNLDFRRGRTFFSIFTALIFFGAGIALIPDIPIFPLLVGIQVLNGALLPIILVFILLLVNNEHLMGDLKNSKIYNILGWGTFVMITVAVVIMLGGQILDLFGIELFGG